MPNKISETIIVSNELGLHARPAGRIAKLAQNAKSNVWVIKNGEKADASSVIDILSLGCTNGAEITFQIDVPDDLDVLNSIIDFIEKGFGE